MKLLALDTSTEACSVALQSDSDIFEQNELAGRQQTERILPMIDLLMDEAGIALKELDAIVLGRGPGAFTGLRVSAGVVQGLAYALQVPVITVSSLNILAQTVFRLYGCSHVVSLFDARMSEVYWCSFQADDGLMLPNKEERVSPPSAVEVESGVAWCGAGPGLPAYADIFSQTTMKDVIRYPDVYPCARDAIKLATKALAEGKSVEPEAAIPVYVRNEVAWKKAK